MATGSLVMPYSVASEWNEVGCRQAFTILWQGVRLITLPKSEAVSLFSRCRSYVEFPNWPVEFLSTMEISSLLT
jgi:hypothetical protein